MNFVIKINTEKVFVTVQYTFTIIRLATQITLLKLHNINYINIGQLF